MMSETSIEEKQTPRDEIREEKHSYQDRKLDLIHSVKIPPFSSFDLTHIIQESGLDNHIIYNKATESEEKTSKPLTFNNLTVDAIQPKSERVVESNTKASLKDIVLLLRKHEISSVPIYCEEKKAYVGFIEIKDIGIKPLYK